MYAKSIVAVRWLLGLQYLLSGMNWWYKMLPYPNIHDDPSKPLKYKVAEAMIATGWMFQLAKVIEVATAISLLSNRFVPLMLVASMSVAVTTFIQDAWNYAPFANWLAGTASFKAAYTYVLDAIYFGGVVLIMQGYLMLSYLHVYRPMLMARPDIQQPYQTVTEGSEGTANKLKRWSIALLGALAIVLGITGTGWLAGMVHQWLIPWSSFSIFLQPR